MTRDNVYIYCHRAARGGGNRSTSSRKGSRRPRALAGQGGPVGGAPEWGGDEGGGSSPPTNLFLDGEEAHGGRRWFGELPRAVVDEKRSVGPTNGGGAGEFNERRRRTGEKCGGSGLPETASSGSRGKVLDTTQVLLYACWPGKNLGAGLVGNWRRRGSGQPTVRPGAERAARAVTSNGELVCGPRGASSNRRRWRDTVRRRAAAAKGERGNRGTCRLGWRSALPLDQFVWPEMPLGTGTPAATTTRRQGRGGRRRGRHGSARGRLQRWSRAAREGLAGGGGRPKAGVASRFGGRKRPDELGRREREGLTVGRGLAWVNG
jgi:hypothetical protein